MTSSLLARAKEKLPAINADCKLIVKESVRGERHNSIYVLPNFIDCQTRRFAQKSGRESV